MTKTVYNTQQKLERYSRLSNGMKMPLKVAAGATLLTALSPTDLLQAQCLGAAFNATTVDVDGDNMRDVTFGATFISTSYSGFSINNYQIKGTTDLSVLLTSNGRIRRVGNNEVININNGAFAKIGAGKFLCQSSALGNWCVDRSGFIAIKKNDRIGFIAVNSFNFQFINVPNRGLAPVGITSLDFGNLNCPTLPVELTAFKAIAEKEAIYLQWATASEENNAGFEVERSENGKDFKKMEFVQGNGTTLEAQTYNFTDQTARKGQTYYYRLRQIDFDGKFEYSDIVTAQIISDKIEVAELAPNPVSGSQAQLNISLPNAGEVALQVFDVTGKLLQSNVQELAAGAHTLNVEVAGLAAGTYFVKLAIAGENVYRKLIVD